MILEDCCLVAATRGSGHNGKGNKSMSSLWRSGRAFALLIAAAMPAALSPARGETLELSAQVAAVPQKVTLPATIFIGLNADLSQSLALGGQAIQRGAELAIREVNLSGGVLGQPLALVPRDHRGIPARGIDNVAELAALPDLVAILGGIHTRVIQAELEGIHREGVIYLVPWAAGTAIIDNGYDPNFVFRVSVRDRDAGRYLIGVALERGFKRPGLLLWRTAWGRSNERAMTTALTNPRMPAPPTQWFNSGQQDMTREIDALIEAGADAILLVASAAKGAAIVRSLAARPESKRLPVISHWGVAGADFPALTDDTLEKIDLTLLQTFSFRAPPRPEKARAVLQTHCREFGQCIGPEDIAAPSGFAHAYDLIYLLKAAIEKAGTPERAKVLEALENLDRYEGLMRIYDPPFTPSRHEGLNVEDYSLAVFDRDGKLAPVRER